MMDQSTSRPYTAPTSKSGGSNAGRCARIRNLFDRMCIGVIRTLEKRPGIVDVKLLDRKPCLKSTITEWEKEHQVLLPEDLKNFLTTSDGLLLHWSVRFARDTIKLGKMQINPLNQIVRIPCSSYDVYIARGEEPSSDEDLSEDSERISQKKGLSVNKNPRSASNRFPRSCSYFTVPVFEIDGCDGNGRVGLVIRNGIIGNKIDEQSRSDDSNLIGNHEIWFEDRTGRWFYLAPSFTEYFRLMIMHLGLPQWQCAMTNVGLSSLAMQWFHLYAPVRLAIDSTSGQPNEDIFTLQHSPIAIDIDKVVQDASSNSYPKKLKKRTSTLGSVSNSDRGERVTLTGSRSTSRGNDRINSAERKTYVDSRSAVLGVRRK